jgi:superoxide dismutase, Cu-Zn family
MTERASRADPFYMGAAAAVALCMKPTFSALLLLLLGCGLALAGDLTKAIAVLHPTSGNNVAGTVTFTVSGNNVKVVADITGLAPGKHGFHIHQFGDCSDPKAASAGDHFNPAHKQHGAPDASERHAGDLGNIEADASGKAHLELTDNVMRLTGSDSIIGHAVIVHEKADDLKTQPTGNAGGRLACGVIGVAKE